jgi:hypothetical protein
MTRYAEFQCLNIHVSLQINKIRFDFLELHMMQQCTSKDFSKPNANIYSRGLTQNLLCIFLNFNLLSMNFRIINKFLEILIGEKDL